MLESAPPDFDLTQFFKGIYTFQQWEIFPGFKTQGTKDVGFTLNKLGVPSDLTGKRVLEIAPWNGFFSFECARRGAAEVVSLGPDDPDVTGYHKTREFLGLDNCTYLRESCYDLSPARHGKFDIVLFLGVIYHLRHPLLALDRIYDIASDCLYVDSPVIDNRVFDKTVSPDIAAKIATQGRVVHELPMLYFTKASETGDPYNWFMPNSRAVVDMVKSAGFEVAHAEYDGSVSMWLSAVKGARNFTIGIEGHNGLAAMQPSNNL